MSRIGAKAKKGRTVKLSPERKRVLRAIVDHLVEQRPLRLTLTSPRTADHMARGFVVAVLAVLALTVAWGVAQAWLVWL